MKKQLISLFLAVLFLLSFTACGTDTKTETGAKDKAQTQTTEQHPTETEAETDTTAPEITEGTAPAVVEKKVDTAVLDQIEQQDTFAVRVIQKESVKGAYDNGSAVVDLNGEDGYILTVMNNTGVDVAEINFVVLATGKDGKGRDLGMLQSIQVDAFQMFEQTPTYNSRVKVMGISDANLTVSSTVKVGVQCSLSDIAYMNVLVLSYIDSNGNEIFVSVKTNSVRNE